MEKKPTILLLLELEESFIADLAKCCPGSDIRTGPWIAEEKQSIPVDLAKGVDIMLCEYPPANFDDFDRLKWIQLTSAGYAHILKLPLVERGIRVTNGLGNFDIPIAEWNIMMMLMWHRNMLDMLQNQRDRKWDRSPKYQAELRGTTVGFYGYGGLARETARIAKSMGLKVWALTRNGSVSQRTEIYCVNGTGDPEGVIPDRIFSTDQIEQFMGGLDYLIVAVPLSPSTKGIISEKELRMLKPSAVLINPARAAIIDEQAYIRCLKEHWIRGSSLDVHYAYPLPPDHLLWSMDNVIMTPHISGSAASTHFIERIYDIFIKNVERFCAGKALLNELTVSQLKGL